MKCCLFDAGGKVRGILRFTSFWTSLQTSFLRISVIGFTCEFWKETHTHRDTHTHRSPSLGTRAKTIKARKCGKQACSSVGWYSVFKSFWHLFFSPRGGSGKHQGRTAVALNQNMPLFLGLQSRLCIPKPRSWWFSTVVQRQFLHSCSLNTSQLACFLTMHILVLLTYSDMTIAFFFGHIEVAPKHLVFEGTESIVLLVLEKWKLYNPPDFMI